MTMGIYKIENTANGKVYVGSSVELKKRKVCHFCALRGSRHKNFHLQNSYNKYGEEFFRFVIVEEIQDVVLLLNRENFWINKLNANNRKDGYNLRKVAESNLGFKHSDETKEKIAKAHKGNKLSEETKHKISEASRGEKSYNWGKRGEDCPNFGRKHTLESRKKMSKALKGKYAGENSKLTGRKRPKEVGERVSRNRIGKGSYGENKYVGVLSKGNKYHVRMGYHGRRIFIGSFSTEEEAAIAYNEKAKELLGINYNINII